MLEGQKGQKRAKKGKKGLSCLKPELGLSALGGTDSSAGVGQRDQSAGHTEPPLSIPSHQSQTQGQVPNMGTHPKHGDSSQTQGLILPSWGGVLAPQAASQVTFELLAVHCRGRLCPDLADSSSSSYRNFVPGQSQGSQLCLGSVRALRGWEAAADCEGGTSQTENCALSSTVNSI